ncbi:MAG TPA: hypothetical protein VHP80_03805, partial [Candidatus Acidoferrum sp.]|nr:hypothetical protein [Candidatus Acidoferrum sp.]
LCSTGALIGGCILGFIAIVALGALHLQGSTAAGILALVLLLDRELWEEFSDSSQDFWLQGRSIGLSAGERTAREVPYRLTHCAGVNYTY